MSAGYLGGKGLTSGWSEARPMLGFGSKMPQLTHLYYGITSGSQNKQLLSSHPQYSVKWPVGVPKYQPFPAQPGGSPAYCSHCLQFGTVFIIKQVWNLVIVKCEPNWHIVQSNYIVLRILLYVNLWYDL